LSGCGSLWITVYGSKYGLVSDMPNIAQVLSACIFWSCERGQEGNKQRCLAYVLTTLATGSLIADMNTEPFERACTPAVILIEPFHGNFLVGGIRSLGRGNRTTDAHVSTHPFFYLTTMDTIPSTTPTSNDFIDTKYRSATITSIVAAASVIVTLFYLAGLYLVAHRWAQDDTSLNKYSSVRLQRSAPCTAHSISLANALVPESFPIVVYLLLVLTSLIEVRFPSRKPMRPSLSGENRSPYLPGYSFSTGIIKITLPREQRRG
jgi:hypothetical protein